MRRALVCWITLLSLAACGGGEAARTEAPEGAGRATVAGVDPVRLMALARVPALGLAVIEEGRVASVEVHGTADAGSGAPAGPETLFEAASLSKPVFATVVLRLAERGEIDLEAPLHQILVESRIAHDRRSEAITPRLVLSHRTGLPNWGGDPLEFESDPGGVFGYSGEGFVYLQKALAERTGLGLEELARREVFEPLGMARSRFSWSEGSDVTWATPHDEAAAPRPKHEPHEGNAAASLHTTAAEYARFVVAWMNGELLAEATTREALAVAVRMRGGETASPREAAVVERIAWGLGWGIQLPEPGSEGAPVYWHWGDNGPAKAFVAFDRAARRGVVYFANSANGLAIAPALVEGVVGDMTPAFEWAGYERHDAPGFAERLEGVVAEQQGRLAEAVAAFRAAAIADPDNEETARRVEWLTDILDARQRPLSLPRSTLERYAGSYGPRELRLEGGTLHYRRGEGTEYELLPLSETLFALEGMSVFRIEVVVDGAGRPIHLVGHYINGQTDESPRDPREAAL